MVFPLLSRCSYPYTLYIIFTYDACFLFRILPLLRLFFFFFNDTATTEIYTLSLHDALPISGIPPRLFGGRKKAIVRTYSYPMNPTLRHAFFADLRTRLGRGGMFVRLHDAANRVAFWLFRGYHVTRRALAAVPPPDTPAVLVGARFNFAYELFFWAARSLSQRLAAVLQTREVARAGFDETDLVFGSGARRRGGGVTFVSSGSTVDRLHSHEAAGRVCVANSLACLLVAIGADVDPTYAGYYADFKSISDGLARYARSVATSAGPVRLTYFHNLVWDGRALRERPKPAPHRDFGDFAAYRGVLEASLAGLAQNLSSSDRAVPLRMLGTISSGYDSPAVTVLAQPYGLQEAIAFEPSSSGAPDSGGAIAQALGVRLRRLARDAWRGPDAPPGPELPFLAADAKGEDVYFQGAEAHLARRVLVTGYHGDQMWSKRPRAAGADIVRGDQSGLSLSEYRLWAGFIHLPVPFLGVRQIGDVSALTRSSAMAPWDVPGAYSRPICRRIVETAGIPRDAFGVRKQTASVLFFERDDMLSPGSLADYGGRLARDAPRRGAQGVGRPTPSPGAAARLRAALARLASPRLRNALGLAHGSRLFPHLFPWAVERVKARYRAAPYEVIAERHLRAPEQRARA